MYIYKTLFDMSCDINCVLNWCLFVFTMFGSLFYILTIIVLIKCRDDMKSSFFKLYTSLGFADIAFLTQTVALRRIPLFLWKFYPNTRKFIGTMWFATIKMMGDWSFYYVQVCGVLILSVNRLTAIMRLNQVETMWSRKVIMIVIVFQWSWLLPFTLPQLHPYCQSHIIGDNISFTGRFKNPQVYYWMWSVDVLLEFCLVSPLLIIIHITLFIKVFKFKAIVAPANQPASANHWSTEFRFALLGSILCSCYLLMATNWAFVWFHERYINRIHALISDTGQLIFTLINPLLLFLFSTKFRNNFLEMFCKK